MTQLQTFAASVSSGRKSWKLEVFDPLGQQHLATYDQHINPGPIVGGFVSRRYANGVCGPFDFEARPDRMIAPDRAIVKLSYDTGRTVISAHYGLLTTTPYTEHKGRGGYQSSGAKELLKNSPIAADDYTYSRTPQDAAIWLRYLVGLYRHPALKFRLTYEDIPLTGVMLGETPEFRGTNLYEAIKGILEFVPSIGEDDWGVDTEGYVVIKPPTGKITLPYAKVSAQWRYGPTRSADTCTKAIIRVANRAGAGVIASTGYRPSLVTHSFEHPAHPAYQATRFFDLPKREDNTPIVEVLRRRTCDDLNPSGWTNPQNIADGNETTFATSNADSTIYAYQTSAAAFKLALAAEAVIDAAAGTYTLSLGMAYYLEGQSVSFAYAYRTLSEIKGEGKVRVRVPVPSAQLIQGQTPGKVAAYLKITGTANGLVKLYELNLLEANTTLLSQIAQSSIRVPAVEVQEITLARGHVGDGDERVPVGGFLLTELGKTLAIPDVPDVNGKTKTVEEDIKEIVDTYSKEEGQLSRIALGDKLRSPRTHAIQDAIRRATEGG